MHLLRAKNTYSKKENINLKADKNFKFKICSLVKKGVKIIAILLISILLMTGLGLVSSGQTESNTVTITVKSGDTLWSIAKRHYGDKNDLRKIIYRIKKMNKLDSVVLQPGQELIIPNKTQ